MDFNIVYFLKSSLNDTLIRYTFMVCLVEKGDLGDKSRDITMGGNEWATKQTLKVKASRSVNL